MGRRLLLVDDDALVLQGLQRVLRTHRPDWQLVLAESGATALRMLEQTPAEVAILDYRMGAMDGLELAKAIRSRHPSTCCIMLTGFADLETAMLAVNEAGIFRFFQKPLAPDRLIEAIEAGLKQRDSRLSMTHALDRLPFGALLVDRSCRVLHRNAVADRLIERGTALSVDPAGRLRSSVRAASEALHRAVEEALTKRANITLPLPRGDDRPLGAAICGAEAQGEVLTLFLGNPDAPPSPSAAAIGNLYKLTPVEARLAAALARGLTVEAAAGELGVTLSSARTYLKTVFAKMGVSRQAEMVREVFCSAAAVAT